MTDLDGLGSLQRLLWRNSHFTITKQLLDEVGDISASNGNVLDAAANDIALSLDKKENIKCKLILKLSHMECGRILLLEKEKVHVNCT